ncbi:MAG TPA: class I SAM-dependent methyltransferase [Anaerolineales bacterium]|nr:class I SAM-dependent methyltransferase [Anaerolineales bacterium]
MPLMRSFYNITYRYFRAPWDIGPRQELVGLVESGRLQPCKVIDLGSGTASNCIFLAHHGFDVTGVDYSPAAVELGQRRAETAGVSVKLLVDDLTNLQHVDGTYDLLVDYGTLDDLIPRDRDLYVQNVLPLTRPGSLFLLYTFEWELRWWERLMLRLAFFGAMALAPGEAERRFAPYFEIERIAGELDNSKWPAGYAVYLMTRKEWTPPPI